LTINSAIDKGMAKLRKYYLKTRALNNKYKVLYLSLILDPRIKSEGLSLISLTSGLSINIKNKLKEEYKL
jgi:hypothetical protein